MKKVLGFDSWTQGSHNYKRITDELKLNGYQLILIHLGSWGHDVRPNIEEKDGDLILRDIAFYKTTNLLKILDLEKPEAVIFLSTTAFAHRAFNRYCKIRGIPTIHLYHGLIAVQSVEGDRLNPVNWKSQLVLLFYRARVNITKIIPLYLKSLYLTNASLNDWGWLYNDIIGKILSKSYSGIAAPDASTSIVCVYVKADINHAVERYRMSQECVYVIGNPDMINFNLDEDIIGCRINNKAKLINNEVIYLDNGLVDVGAIFNNVSDYKDHILKTRDSVYSSGYTFSIKLHPIHFRTGLITLLESEGIEILNNENLIPRLSVAKACIVEPTSAAIIPALIGVPTLLAQYDKLYNQNYGQVLTTYPRSCYLNDLKKLTDNIDLVYQQNDENEIKEWIDKNVGPLPAKFFSQRFVAALKKCINISNPV